MADESGIKKIFSKNGDSEPPKPIVRTVKPVARPVSKKQIDDLHKRLLTPSPRHELTPMGKVTRDSNTECNDKILKEIEAIRHRLELRRDAAKEAFHRAKENQTAPRKRKP